MLDVNTVSRLEDKLDKLTEAVTRLILLEERQNEQRLRIDDLEDSLDALDTRLGKVSGDLSKYTYLVVGAAGAVSLLWTVGTFVVKMIQ